MFKKLLFTIILGFGLSVSNSYGQCCKCFSSSSKCSTECNHDSGRDWCGCDTGCDCGSTCGGPGEDPELKDIGQLLETGPEEAPLSGFVVTVTEETIKNLDNSTYGYLDGYLAKDTYFVKGYGLFKISDGLYKAYSLKENDQSFAIRNCKGDVLVQVFRKSQSKLALNNQ